MAKGYDQEESYFHEKDKELLENLKKTELEASEASGDLTILPGSRVRYFDDVAKREREVTLAEAIVVKASSKQVVEAISLD